MPSKRRPSNHEWLDHPQQLPLTRFERERVNARGARVKQREVQQRLACIVLRDRKPTRTRIGRAMLRVLRYASVAALLIASCADSGSRESGEDTNPDRDASLARSDAATQSDAAGQSDADTRDATALGHLDGESPDPTAGRDGATLDASEPARQDAQATDSSSAPADPCGGCSSGSLCAVFDRDEPRCMPLKPACTASDPCSCLKSPNECPGCEHEKALLQCVCLTC